MYCWNSTDVSEEDIASIRRESRWQAGLPSDFTLVSCSTFDHEDGCDMFLRNVGLIFSGLHGVISLFNFISVYLNFTPPPPRVSTSSHWKRPVLGDAAMLAKLCLPSVRGWGEAGISPQGEHQLHGRRRGVEKSQAFPPSLYFLKTDSDELSPSWEASSYAANKEIPNILRNLTVYYRIHKSDRQLSLSSARLNPVHTTPSYFGFLLKK
jgi:hypothetical protein